MSFSPTSVQWYCYKKTTVMEWRARPHANFYQIWFLASKWLSRAREAVFCWGIRACKSVYPFHLCFDGVLTDYFANSLFVVTAHELIRWPVLLSQNLADNSLSNLSSPIYIKSFSILLVFWFVLWPSTRAIYYYGRSFPAKFSMSQLTDPIQWHQGASFILFHRISVFPSLHYTLHFLFLLRKLFQKFLSI